MGLFGKKGPSANIVKDAVEGIVSGAGDLFDKVSTSDEEKLEHKNKLAEIVLPHVTKALEVQGTALTTEMTGSKLQRNWRPIVMLAFAGIVCYEYFFSKVFSLPSSNLPDRFFDLLELGLGGYVIGRSVEKVADTLTKNVDLSFIRKKDRKESKSD